MRVVALVALFFVAGTCALPASEVAAPSQNRFMEMIVVNVLRQINDFIVSRGWDNVNMEHHTFDVNIIDNLVFITGFVENLKFTGLGGGIIHYVSYNLVFGRLEIDIELPELYLSVGKYVVNIRYGPYDIKLEVSGTVVVTSIRLSGNAVLVVTPDSVTVLNINPDLRIGGIQSEVTVYGAEDYSETVNDFINRRIPSFFIIYRNEINTVIGEIIRWLVHTFR